MPKKKSGGAPPTYAPETKARRAAGQIAIRIPPDLADQIRAAARDYPGGVSGWLADAARVLLKSKTPGTIPEGSAAQKSAPGLPSRRALPP